MTFNYPKNASVVGEDKKQKATGVFDIKQSPRLIGFLSIGDRIVFTSALWHGALGPSKTNTDAFYADYYSQDIIDLFGTQQLTGIQRFNVPQTGSYRFTIQGGYAGTNNFQTTATNDLNTNVISTSGTVSATGYTGDYTYGLPGYLVTDTSLSEGDTLDILVGHAGGCCVYSSNNLYVANSGGGASAVWINGISSSSKFAIAGGAGSNRDQADYGINTAYNNGNSPYSTTGGEGYQSTSVYSGGTNGSGGSGNNNGAGGSGLSGSGSLHNDNRTPMTLNQTADPLYLGGKGGISAASYANPFSSSSSSGELGFYVNPTTHKVTDARFWGYNDGVAGGGFNFNDYTNYFNGTSATLTGWIPVSGATGGFGGGGCGNWGGAGGGGGYSGGGGGANGDVGGGGSSYIDTNYWTFVSHTNNSKTTGQGTYHRWDSPLESVGAKVTTGGINKRLPTGCYKGNGFVAMEYLG